MNYKKDALSTHAYLQTNSTTNKMLYHLTYYVEKGVCVAENQTAISINSMICSITWTEINV